VWQIPDFNLRAKARPHGGGRKILFYFHCVVKGKGTGLRPRRHAGSHHAGSDARKPGGALPPGQAPA